MKSYQAKLVSGLSLKSNNLKYHLMRQMLQSKNLDEIISLKEKLSTSQAAAA